MNCVYCGVPIPRHREHHLYCSAFCDSHAKDEEKLVGIGSPPVATRLEIVPPAHDTDPPTDTVLPTDSDERKEIPLFSGALNYFPLALAAVARVSKRGNDKHNPGQAIHWARGKSMDHADCIARHLLDIETRNAQGEYEDAMSLAWRALAKLQELEEKRLGKPMSRGSRPAE